ncbi:MAG TPA: helix-turn-helix domain-containing protein [Roseiflexaceae bacterium]|nr:helix-turn-helix domain-containing protein [Roseiflexaceae bacterium]
MRRKLEDDPANPAMIQTVRGVGYKFVGHRK